MTHAVPGRANTGVVSPFRSPRPPWAVPGALLGRRMAQQAGLRPVGQASRSRVSCLTRSAERRAPHFFFFFFFLFCYPLSWCLFSCIGRVGNKAGTVGSSAGLSQGRCWCRHGMTGICW